MQSSHLHKIMHKNKHFKPVQLIIFFSQSWKFFYLWQVCGEPQAFLRFCISSPDLAKIS